MEDTAVLTAIGELKGQIGELNGQMQGIGREIRDIKSSLNNQDECCRDCKKEINSDIATVKGDVATLKNGASGLSAVKSWIDTTTGKLASCIVAACAILGLVLGLKGH